MGDNCVLGCLDAPDGQNAACIDQARGASCDWSNHDGRQLWTCAQGSLFKCNESGAPMVAMCSAGCTTGDGSADDTCN